MISIWDLYLDVDDAVTVLEAVVVLERNRAVREPLPLEDVTLLHDRLTTVAEISAEDAVYWQREADDRREAAAVDGGRWGSRELATTMHGVAVELAGTSRRIAVVAESAAADLGQRLAALPTAAGEVQDAVALEAARLLERDSDG